MCSSDLRLLAAELRALALLRHPGIVHLYDAGTVLIHGIDYAFLAMEFVDGMPLTKWAEQQQEGLSSRLQLVIALCAALSAAHQRGVIHRDLKPENVLVRIIDGVMKKGQKVRLVSTNAVYQLDRVGVSRPKKEAVDDLGPEIGRAHV